MSSAYGTVMKAGAAAMARSRASLRHGQFSKNVKSNRTPKPGVGSTLMSMTSPIKGKDKGTG